MYKRLTDAGEHISFEFLRELLVPTVSPIRGARNKELMYPKTGLFINQAPEHESPVLLDMVAEAEQVMGTLESNRWWRWNQSLICGVADLLNYPLLQFSYF